MTLSLLADAATMLASPIRVATVIAEALIIRNLKLVFPCSISKGDMILVTTDCGVQRIVVPFAVDCDTEILCPIYMRPSTGKVLDIKLRKNTR